MQKNLIFHVDVNSAFLSWEAVYRLNTLGAKDDLRDIPSAVVGDVKKRHGIVLAKSHPAKRFGIKTGETIGEAQKKCPNLELVAPHYNLYDKCSTAFIEILERFTPCVEQYSIDEAYCNMTGTMSLYGSPIVTANLIKDTILKELGFSVNIGVSSNKLLAKMASDFKKPNMVHTLFEEEIKEKMWNLPVSELFYVGRATTTKLFTMGIKTIGELANTDPKILISHFKKHGEIMYAFANGIDLAKVESEHRDNKGYGNGMTIPFDIDDKVRAKHVLLALCETVGTRLRKDAVRAGVISVNIVYYDFAHQSHQMTIEPTNITNEIHSYACRLFEELWDGTPFRNIGVHTSKVSKEVSFTQMNLFNETYEQLEKMDSTVDKIRERFGEDALMRGVFLGSPICHMSGGISRDKKKANYEDVDIE